MSKGRLEFQAFKNWNSNNKEVEKLILNDFPPLPSNSLLAYLKPCVLCKLLDQRGYNLVEQHSGHTDARSMLLQKLVMKLFSPSFSL